MCSLKLKNLLKIAREGEGWDCDRERKKEREMGRGWERRGKEGRWY